MAKDKKRDDQGRFVKEDDGKQEETDFNPFVGGEDDDLMDMKYVQDESTIVENTHPPETKEEAEILAAERAEAAKQEEDDGVRTEETDEEATEEVSAQAEEEDTEEAVEEEPKIPKSRFDEVNEAKKKEKERADRLEKQLEDLVEKKKEPEPEPFDYAEKEKESYDAFLEGDTEKYSTIQQEIRAAQKEELRREAERIAAEGDQTVRETLTFEETGERIETEYPALVRDSENFNEDAYSDLMDLYVGYVNTGRYSRADALQMAADKSVRIHGLKKQGSNLAKDGDNKVVELSTKKPDLKKKQKVAESQPPLKESGAAREDQPLVDVASMSDEEFAALPEATKRRLRGDVM
jgi:hypothetical protein